MTRRRKRKGRKSGEREEERSDISTHHSPVSVSGMMQFSFHDVLQTRILWGKISTYQLIHNKRTGERGEWREEGGE